MLKVAITGNIACGKTLVESFIIDAGYKVLCLDKMTHFLYDNDSDVKNAIYKEFNTLNRKEIAKIVFSDHVKKKRLENIIYPKLRLMVNEFFLMNKNDPMLFVSAAQLFEAEFYDLFDKIIYVYADADIRLKRLIERDKLSKEDALIRISAQNADADKIKKSDFVIENNSDIQTLKENTYKTTEALNTLL